MSYSLIDIQKRIEQAIQGIDLAREPRELYDPIIYTLRAGGKRMRPALTLMSCNLFSDDIEPALNAALGLEIFHNFTLLHDDIMDRAEIRRGKPTVHLKWDENIAILSGDVMQILAFEFISNCDCSKLPQVLKVFNKTAIEVCEGQQYDMNFESRNDVTTDEYLNMIRLKTSVLLGACTQIGAILGGAGTEDAEQMYKFGVDLGISFQLKDDYLDTFGDVEKFGKKIGGDILAKKKTYLFLKALEKADNKQKNQLEEWYTTSASDPDKKIRDVIQIFRSLNVHEELLDLAHQYSKRAMNILDGLNIKNSRKRAIKTLSQTLLSREH